MLFIILSMLVVIVVAGLVVTFVAFPHRGEDVPGAPWLSDAMNQANEALPTIRDGEVNDPDPQSDPQPGTQAGSTPETGPQH